MGTTTVLKNLSISGEIADVICENGVITSVGKTSLAGIDFGGKRAYPGLVDIHTHGMGGMDTMDAEIVSLAKLYAKSGTTSCMPTTMTADKHSIQKVLEAESVCADGAEVIGFHLEGPYINAELIGAQNPDHVRLPDYSEIEAYKNIGMITIAPELDGAMECIKKANAVISLAIRFI